MYYLEFRRFAKLALQLLPSSGDRIHIVVKELFDPQGYFDVAAAIATLARPVLLWRKLWKFRVPIPNYVSLHADKIAHFADLEVQFFGDCRSRFTHSFVKAFYS